MPVSNSNQSPLTMSGMEPGTPQEKQGTRPALAEITAWLVEHLAESLELEVEDIDIDKDFTYYGLNSMEMINISGELEEYLGCRLDPTLVLSYPNIRLLAEHLVENEAVVTVTDRKEKSQGDAAQILANLDQLSDTEVDDLLTTLLEDEHGDD